MKNSIISIVGIIVTILIYYVSSTYGNLINLKIDFIPHSFGLHTIMFLLSITAIYFFKKYVSYRIELPKFKTLLKPIGFGLLVSILAAVIMSITLIISSGESSPEIKMPTSNLSVLQIIIFVFIFASIAEEMLFRGFLLNILKPLKKKGISVFKRKISLAVIISALMFGLIHILPLNSDNSIIFTIGMFIAPSLLGIVAGYYQEKFDNNFYAIIVHMAGNLIGIIGTIVMNANS
jgi:membrane protease YdiL (CAAX protease family)